MAGHLNSDEFFTQLTTLLASTHQKGHGSVYLTQKRLTYPPTTTTDSLSDLPQPLLIRATDGKSRSLDPKSPKKQKFKISTVVPPEELEVFFTRYAEVCKAGMVALKKRDRSKRKKVKGKKK